MAYKYNMDNIIENKKQSHYQKSINDSMSVAIVNIVSKIEYEKRN